MWNTGYPSSKMKAGGIAHRFSDLCCGWWGVMKHEVESSELETGIWRGPEE